MNQDSENPVYVTHDDSPWSPFKRSLGPAIIGALVAVLVASIQILPIGQGQLWDRVKVLEQEVDELETLNRNLTLEDINNRETLALLKIEVEKLSDVDPSKTISDFLDSIPSPAWCKTWDAVDQVFVMESINDVFEYVYRITKENYEGKTDFDIHPIELAQEYFNNDFEIWSNKSRKRYTETTFNLITGEPIQISSFKFYHQSAIGKSYVCGIQISSYRKVTN